jgi:hypothetical protein
VCCPSSAGTSGCSAVKGLAIPAGWRCACRPGRRTSGPNRRSRGAARFLLCQDVGPGKINERVHRPPGPTSMAPEGDAVIRRDNPSLDPGTGSSTSQPRCRPGDGMRVLAMFFRSVCRALNISTCFHGAAPSNGQQRFNIWLVHRRDRESILHEKAEPALQLCRWKTNSY